MPECALRRWICLANHSRFSAQLPLARFLPGHALAGLPLDASIPGAGGAMPRFCSRLLIRHAWSAGSQATKLVKKKEDGLVGILPLQVKWVTRDKQRNYLHNPYDPRDGNDPWPPKGKDARGPNAWD